MYAPLDGVQTWLCIPHRCAEVDSEQCTRCPNHRACCPPSCVPIRQIMGRSENDELSASQVFYPCMQAADIFFLKVR